MLPVCRNGHVWLSLCDEFFEVLKDNEVMEEVKEVMWRAKTKKDNEKNKEKEKEKEVSTDLKSCGQCREKIKGSQTSVKCIRCEFWIHLKCTQFISGAEARRNQETFLCKSCTILEDYYNDKKSKTGDDENRDDENENLNKKKR